VHLLIQAGVTTNNSFLLAKSKSCDNLLTLQADLQCRSTCVPQSTAAAPPCQPADNSVLLHQTSNPLHQQRRPTPPSYTQHANATFVSYQAVHLAVQARVINNNLYKYIKPRAILLTLLADLQRRSTCVPHSTAAALPCQPASPLGCSATPANRCTNKGTQSQQLQPNIQLNNCRLPCSASCRSSRFDQQQLPLTKIKSRALLLTLPAGLQCRSPGVPHSTAAAVPCQPASLLGCQQFAAPTEAATANLLNLTS
jgi:hypothetical protein